MPSQKTITINGRKYDGVTGLPVKDSEKNDNTRPKPSEVSKGTQQAKKPASGSSKPVNRTSKPVSSEGVHSTLQRSTALAMRVAKKPIISAQKIVRRPSTGRAMDIGPKPGIIQKRTAPKFAPDPVVRPPREVVKPVDISSKTTDRPPQSHPAAIRAMRRAKLKKQAILKAQTPKTNHEIKEEAIKRALDAPKPKIKSKTKKVQKNPWTKRLIIIGSVLVAIAAVAYAVYRFVPAVSVSIAASQAGVEAHFPDYIPDGYAFHQPVTYTDGEVGLTFKSNSNDSSYVLTQKRSSWDSSAVLDNVVIPIVGDSYTITKERGLTIYTYGNGAAWVNGGILYIIDGSTVLSNDQIRHIATSL